MSRWYVSIDHLSDEELEFFGWYRVREDDQFIVYERAYGDDPQIVSKSGEKFIYVEDYNDAVRMKAGTVIVAPPDGDE
jgi:hypothetical protein